MRILICTGIYPPDIGGPATYSKLLKDELPNHGFEVDVLSFGGVRRFPKIIRHSIYFFKVLKRGFGVDVIYAQDPVSVGLPSFLAAKILNASRTFKYNIEMIIKKTFNILSLHRIDLQIKKVRDKKFLLKVVGDYAWEQHQIQNSKFKIQNYNENFITLEAFQLGDYSFITELRRKIERWVATKANKIIVPSEYLKKIVKQWGIKEEKITVIYNSLEGDIAISVSKKENIIFSAGRLVPWKGFELLIEVMRELPADFKLFVAGNGPKEQDLKLKIENLKLDSRVILLGNLDRDQMRHYFSLVKAFVLNTSYEGLSHILLEAMQNSVPVITTNVGGNPELIKNNFNGLLVEYNNKNELKGAILKIMNDVSLQNKFIGNSYKELEKFSKERMINSISEVLLSL